MTDEIETKTISPTTSIQAFSESSQAHTFYRADPENRERPRNILPDCKTVLPGLNNLIRKHSASWPDDIRLSAEIAMHTLRTMQSPSFHQSKALQELARRNFADLDAKLKALS